jgi:hypothetical protein
MEIGLIPPRTSANTDEANDILMNIKRGADLPIPLQESRFTGGAVIG